jgi:hypothetical protein
MAARCHQEAGRMKAWQVLPTGVPPGSRLAGRMIRAAVIADLVLVAAAAAIAIALLIVAWP